MFVIRNLLTGRRKDGKPIAASAQGPLSQHWLEICCFLEIKAPSKDDVYMGGCVL